MAKHDDADLPISNPSHAEPLEAMIDARISRRDALRGAGAMAVLASAGFSGITAAPRPAAAQSTRSSLTFTEIAHGLDERHHTPPGYSAQVVVRWGDPVMPGAPAWDPRNQSAAAQTKQFGYDNDFLAYMPLPYGSNNSDHGLLCSNHERCNSILMFPGVTAQNRAALPRPLAEVEMASQGHAVVEIRKNGRQWQVVPDSRYNRRHNPFETRMRVAGPAAGHDRMKTAADPEGRTIIGTLNNCAGGTTPWGTILTGEENLHNYFIGNADQGPEAAARRRYGVNGRGSYNWGRYHDRFNLDRENNEPNRFGWVVEIDPYEPDAMPVKRTAIGRFKHEGAATAISHDGRIAVYSGDDERFEYVYKFVTARPWNPNNRAANRDLLDEGTLYVARFEENGRMRWLPLVHGQGPLTAANGFASQADVMIEARRAADLLGATPMDRPEDIEPNPQTGRVYVVLTYNEQRKAANDPNERQRVNPANPRVGNRYGHIIEIVPPNVNGRPDHAATESGWEFFLVGGNPADPQHGAAYQGPISENGWVACPDNVAFDPRGRIWIVTDGQDDAINFADSCYAADTSGPGRGITRLFFNAPRGAEICGPEFTPDGKTLFLAIQHPAEENNSSFDQPSTRWPDFQANMPARPAVVAVTKDDGGEVGS